MIKGNFRDFSGLGCFAADKNSESRVADPAHFFCQIQIQQIRILTNRILIRILLALTKNQFKDLNFFVIHQISSHTFMCVCRFFLPEKLNNSPFF